MRPTGPRSVDSSTLQVFPLPLEMNPTGLDGELLGDFGPDGGEPGAARLSEAGPRTDSTRRR